MLSSGKIRLKERIARRADEIDSSVSFAISALESNVESGVVARPPPRTSPAKRVHHPQSVRAWILLLTCWDCPDSGTDRPQHRAASQCPVLLRLREECLKVSKGSGRLLCMKVGWLFYTHPRVVDIFLSDVLLVGNHLLE